MTRLPGDSEALARAAVWLRDQLQLPPSSPIFDQFEQYFDCTLQVDNRADPWCYPNWAEFASSQDLTMFLLRWS